MIISPASATSYKSIDKNSTYLVKYRSNNTGINTIELSNANLKIHNVYMRTVNKAFDQIESLNIIKDDNSIDVYLQNNTTYYFILRNTTTSTASTNCRVFAISHTLYNGENPERGFAKDANFVYYKYIVGDENADVTFLFEGDLKQGSVSFVVLNSLGKAVASDTLDAFGDGYVKVRNMLAGQTYYVGVKATETVLLKPIVTTAAVQYVWKLYQEEQWVELDALQDIRYDSDNRMIFLLRGHTYQFGLWLDGFRVKYYLKPSDNQVSSAQLDKLNGILSLMSDRKVGAQLTLAGSHDLSGDLVYSNTITIFTEFSVDEISLDGDIDYVNKVLLRFNVPEDTKEMTGKIVYNDGKTTAIAKKINWEAPSVDLLQALCIAKAKTAKFVLEKIILPSVPDDNSTRSYTLNKEYEINCYYTYTTTSKPLLLTYYTNHITNSLQLYNLRYAESCIWALDNDIDLKHFTPWEPIPSWNLSLNGNGYKITSLKISNITDGNNYGFIAYNSGFVMGVNIENIYIVNSTVSNSDSWTHIGGVVGENSGWISDCTVTGTINVRRNYGAVGGIAGTSDKSINLCTFGDSSKGRSIVAGSGDTGGIAGSNYGLIQDCAVENADISQYLLASARSVGGVVGYGNNCTVETSGIRNVKVSNLNTANVSIQPYMGLLVGSLINSTITSCFGEQYYTSIGKVTNTRYCFNGAGDWKFFGKLENCTVDNNANQNGP